MKRKYVVIRDEHSKLFGHRFLNSQLSLYLGSIQLLVCLWSLTQHIWAMVSLNKILHCDFSDNSMLPPMLTHVDAIIFDIGLFHHLWGITGCVAQHLDGGYGRFCWCIVHTLALLFCLPFAFVSRPKPHWLWPLLIQQSAYGVGLLILSLAALPRAAHLLGDLSNAPLQALAFYAVGTLMNFFLLYVYWHWYWHVEALWSSARKLRRGETFAGSTKRPMRRCSPVGDEQQQQQQRIGTPGRAPLLGMTTTGGVPISNGHIPTIGEPNERTMKRRTTSVKLKKEGTVEETVDDDGTVTGNGKKDEEEEESEDGGRRRRRRRHMMTMPMPMQVTQIGGTEQREEWSKCEDGNTVQRHPKGTIRQLNGHAMTGVGGGHAKQQRAELRRGNNNPTAAPTDSLDSNHSLSSATAASTATTTTATNAVQPHKMAPPPPPAPSPLGAKELRQQSRCWAELTLPPRVRHLRREQQRHHGPLPSQNHSHPPLHPPSSGTSRRDSSSTSHLSFSSMDALPSATPFPMVQTALNSSERRRSSTVDGLVQQRQPFGGVFPAKRRPSRRRSIRQRNLMMAARWRMERGAQQSASVESNDQLPMAMANGGTKLLMGKNENGGRTTMMMEWRRESEDEEEEEEEDGAVTARIVPCNLDIVDSDELRQPCWRHNVDGPRHWLSHDSTLRWSSTRADPVLWPLSSSRIIRAPQPKHLLLNGPLNSLPMSEMTTMAKCRGSMGSCWSEPTAGGQRLMVESAGLCPQMRRPPPSPAAMPFLENNDAAFEHRV